MKGRRLARRDLHERSSCRRVAISALTANSSISAPGRTRCLALVFANEVARFTQPVAGVAGTAARIVILARYIGIDVVDAERKCLEQRLDRFSGEHAEFVVVVEPEALGTLFANQADIERLVEIPVHRAGVDVYVRGHEHARVGQRLDETRPYVGTGMVRSPFSITAHRQSHTAVTREVLLPEQAPKLRLFYRFAACACIVDAT